MQTRQDTLLNFIGSTETQLLIPVYQRVYSWSPKQCETLWDDVMRAGKAGTPHFIGTVLYAVEPAQEGQVLEGAIQRRLDIIDGQQRSVTVSLLLTALRDYLAETGKDLDGVDAAYVNDRYLHIDGKPKMILSRMDRATMEAVLEKTPLPEEDDLSAKVVENHQHFLGKLRKLEDDELLTFWAGLQLLLVVLAEMDGDDRPQLIFESLNAKGMPLTTADLVRNLLLVNTTLEEQDRLYEKYWAPIERMYDDGDSTRLNAALHGWLATKAPKLRVKDKDQVYGAFKLYLETVENRSMEEILIGLKGFCQTFATKSASANKRVEQGGWGIRADGHLISDKKLFGD